MRAWIAAIGTWTALSSKKRRTYLGGTGGARPEENGIQGSVWMMAPRVDYNMQPWDLCDITRACGLRSGQRALGGSFFAAASVRAYRRPRSQAYRTRPERLLVV